MATYIVLGDIHSTGFNQLCLAIEAAERTESKLILLGDLVDRGDDIKAVQAVLYSAFRDGLIDTIIIGNHDLKMWRALAGAQVKLGEDAQKTFDFFQLNPGYAAHYVEMLETCGKVIHIIGQHYFVHGGLPKRLPHASVTFTEYLRDQKAYKSWLACAFFNHTTGKTLPTGFPERDMSWINGLPKGLICWKGHDFIFNTPTISVGSGGGAVVFMDTGSGFEGGSLSFTSVSDDDTIESLTKRLSFLP